MPSWLNARAPCPQSGGYGAGQAAIQLAGYHHYLAPMMRVMGDEIGQDMPDVEGQVAPHVGLGGRYATTPTAPQLQEGGDTPTTPVEGRAELPAGDGPVIDPCGGSDPMLLPQRLDPGAPCIMEVGGDGSDRAGRDPGDGRGPEDRGDVLDEVAGDATVGPPRSQDGLRQVPIGGDMGQVL